jgi:zinc protease
LQTTPVSQQELARVKAQVIAQKVFTQDSLLNQAMELGTPESIGLSWHSAQTYVNNISKITAAQIQQIAKDLLTPQRLTITVLNPVGEFKEKPTDSMGLSSTRLH